MIKDLTELQAFLKICRKQGVSEIRFSGTTVIFGEAPSKSRKDDDVDPEGLPEELSPEQLMFYSAGGVPPP